MTTLRSIVTAARAGAASLVGETAGYLILGAADAALAGPIRASLDTVSVTLDGNVVVERDSGDPVLCERALRGLLAELLASVRLAAPNLAVVAEAGGTLGLPSLVRELEAALVPVNRKAAKRALSRLARDTERAFEREPRLSSLHVEAVPSRPVTVEPLDAEEEPPTPELPVTTVAPEESSTDFAEREFEVEVEVEAASETSFTEAPVVVESRDERYLTEEGVLEAMLSMRPAHRDTAWADEDDFLTEIWAARSVRPPSTLVAPPGSLREPEGEPAARVVDEEERALPTVPAVASEGGAEVVDRLSKMHFDSHTMVPMPVELRPSVPVIGMAEEFPTLAAPSEGNASASLPSFRRTLADFESPEPPVLTRPAPARPLGPFEIPEGEAPASVVTPKRSAAPLLAPIVLRVEDAPVTIPSGPLLELGEPAPRRRSDIAALLAGRAVDARPPAELLATLQSLSRLGTPRLPAELVALSESAASASRG